MVSQARYVTEIIAAFKRHGDRPALAGADYSISYGELLDNVYQLAHVLDRLGLRRGDGFACVTGNGPEAVPLRIAAHVLGLRYVPFNLDAKPLEAQVAHILTDATPRAVVYDPAYPVSHDPLPVLARRANAEYLLSLGPDGPEQDLRALAAKEPTEPVEVRASEDDIAQVTYTGGTMGEPKGVMVDFAALHALSSETPHERTPEGQRFIVVTSLGHAVGPFVLRALHQGIPVEVHAAFDVETFVGAVARSGPVMTVIHPDSLYKLLDHSATVNGCPNLASVFYVGSPMAPSRLREAMERFGPIFHQGYGQSEARSLTYLTVADHLAGMNDRPHLLTSVGRPRNNVRIEIRDEAGKALPAGEIGEVCVRSNAMMVGYWRRPELTAQVLRDGWLHTGDLGNFDDEGYLYLVGRAKDMIIVDGYNYYAVPIESALASHPAVSQAAVVGAASDRTGEAIHAFIVPTPGISVDQEELRELIREQLNVTYVPETFQFIDAMPLTAVGKPGKKALKARLNGVV